MARTDARAYVAVGGHLFDGEELGGEELDSHADLIAAMLHDTRSLDRARLAPVAAALPVVLAGLGAKETSLAYCISALDDLDDRELPLGDALRTAIGRQQDTLIYSLVTRRANLETHEGDSYLLRA